MSKINPIFTISSVFHCAMRIIFKFLSSKALHHLVALLGLCSLLRSMRSQIDLANMTPPSGTKVSLLSSLRS